MLLTICEPILLINRGLIREISFNKKKNGYMRGIKYSETVESLY